MEVLQWVEKVSKWGFTRIIPAHLTNDVRAGPTELKDAFRFLEQPSTFPYSLVERRAPEALPRDRKLLEDLSVSLTTAGVLNEAVSPLPRNR